MEQHRIARRLNDLATSDGQADAQPTCLEALGDWQAEVSRVPTQGDDRFEFSLLGLQYAELHEFRAAFVAQFNETAGRPVRSPDEALLRVQRLSRLSDLLQLLNRVSACYDEAQAANDSEIIDLTSTASHDSLGKLSARLVG